MERCFHTALGLVLATMLAGCAEMRWCRNCCCCCDSDAKSPASPASETRSEPKTSSLKSEPAHDSGALAIPAGAHPGQDKTPASLDAGSVNKSVSPNHDSAAPSRIAPVSLIAKPEPTPAGSPAETENPLRTLHRRAKQKFESINAYEMRMRRREIVNGKSNPEELVEARFRREPFSVYFKWVGPQAKGREVVYVHGRHGSLIHTLTAAGDVPLMPAGMRFKVAPDSPMVKGKSRTSITEAGLGSLIDRFGKLVDATERGDAGLGTAKPMGAFKRTEFEEKVEGVIQTIPPGVEPLLPGGGQRLWCFDIEHGLPVLVVTHDDQNREVEYCCHDRFAFPPHLSDDAFDPEVLWRK
jgi:hypothetical protein